MASYDSADLLARLKDMLLRPSSDQSVTDAQLYTYLSDAQVDYYGIFATQCPHILAGAPTAMSTADSGVTYTFSGSVRPLWVEVYDSSTGRLLQPAAYWDGAGDYVWEGTKIRMCKGGQRTFTPYARIITPPTVIDGSTAPTLVPDYARQLLVLRAAAQYCLRGGLRDPTPFEAMETKRAWGDQRVPGDIGIVGNLKTANPWLGAAAIPASPEISFANLYQISGYAAL